MSILDTTLKMYAQSGLRSEKDWISIGRSVATGTVPRVDAASHGIISPLFSRDQTQVHRSEGTKQS